MVYLQDYYLLKRHFNTTYIMYVQNSTLLFTMDFKVKQLKKLEKLLGH